MQASISTSVTQGPAMWIVPLRLLCMVDLLRPVFEGAHGRDHHLQVVFRQLWIDRKRKYPRHKPLGVVHAATYREPPSVCRLLMHRLGIVLSGTHARAAQMRHQLVASLARDDALMVDVRGVCSGTRQPEPASLEGLAIPVCNGRPSRIVGVEIGQLGAQDSRLNLIQAGVRSGNFADVAVLPTILAEQAHLVRKGGIGGYND